MKLQKTFGLPLVVLFLALSGLSRSYAQDQGVATPQTPTDQAATAPKKLSTNDKLKVLEAQNQSLEERLKTLEDKVQSTAQAVHMASPVVAPNPQDQVGPTGGGFEEESVATTSGDYFDTEPRFLVFKGANGAEFKLGGYFWSDLNINNQSFSVNQGVTLPPTYINGLVANNDNAFTKMKSHLDFRVSFDKFVGGAIGLESDKHSSINVGFYHAYLTVKFDKFLRFRAGKFTNPLSLEGDQPSAVLPFVEPSMVADLAVNKDFGAMLNGKVGDDLFEYWLEVANGQQDNESSATGPDPDGLSDFKALTARIFFTPWLRTSDEWLNGLGFGVAASMDNKSDGGENLPWQKIETSIGGNSFLPSNTLSMKAAGDFYHLDAHGYYYNGPFGFLGEYIDSIQTIKSTNSANLIAGAVPVQLTYSGWLAEVQWVIGGKAGFEGALVDHPFDPSKGQWGALELVARMHGVFLDVKTFTVGFPYAPVSPLAYGAQVATAYGVGFNWWLNENFKFMCDGEETDFSGGNEKIAPEQILVARAAFTI